MSHGAKIEKKMCVSVDCLFVLLQSERFHDKRGKAQIYIAYSCHAYM